MSRLDEIKARADLNKGAYIGRDRCPYQDANDPDDLLCWSIPWLLEQIAERDRELEKLKGKP